MSGYGGRYGCSGYYTFAFPIMNTSSGALAASLGTEGAGNFAVVRSLISTAKKQG
jgi:hypothetical protein